MGFVLWLTLLCALLAGFDFLLDTCYKPWLLEVNASPSMAWHTPGQPGATQLMHSVKQQMLTDLFALLRLQDRYPAAAAAAAGGAATAAGAMQRQPADRGVNPVLLQAASEAYFGSRPQVAEMVAQDVQQLAAAVAEAPKRQDVAAEVQLRLQRLEQQEGQQDRSGLPGVLQEHLQQIVDVECELQSSRGWTSLLPHMQECCVDGGHLHGSAPVDAAIRSWYHLRQQVVAAL